MDCIFNQVQIWHMAKNCTQIFWSLDRPTMFKGRYWFFIDYGRDGTDEWIAVNRDPVVDDCWFQDCCQRHWGNIIGHSYRIRLVLPDEPGCPVFKSQPYSADMNLDRQDWLVLRDMVRKHHLQQRKREGVEGFLLKRKHFGKGCPQCLDWETREVTDSDCPICYGVGIVGGYYPGIEYWVTLQGAWKRRLTMGDQGPRGTSSDIVQRGDVILYPRIDTKDVWVNARTDQRWIIDSYTVTAQYRGIPFLAAAELRLAPATDTVYNIPIEGTPSSSSVDGSESSEECDVTRGLDASYEDW